MKSYIQFIDESQKVLNKISSAYGKKHRGVNIDASYDEKSNSIRLNNIWLPPEKRGQGIGGRIMKGLSKYADKQGSNITLSQAPEKGKKQKLDNFYKSHGFKPNRGRSRDFSTKDTHIRNPNQ